MEFTPPPAGPSVPVSNTGNQRSEPPLFWTEQRRALSKQLDRSRRIHAALAGEPAFAIADYLATRKDLHVILERIRNHEMEDLLGQ